MPSSFRIKVMKYAHLNAHCFLLLIVYAFGQVQVQGSVERVIDFTCAGFGKCEYTILRLNFNLRQLNKISFSNHMLCLKVTLDNALARLTQEYGQTKKSFEEEQSRMRGGCMSSFCFFLI